VRIKSQFGDSQGDELVYRAGIVDWIQGWIDRSSGNQSAAGALRFNEIAWVFMRCDHVASVIMHANHDRMGTAVVHRVCESIANRIGFAVPEPAERQHVAD